MTRGLLSTEDTLQSFEISFKKNHLPQVALSDDPARSTMGLAQLSSSCCRAEFSALETGASAFETRAPHVAALPGVGICHPPGGGMQEFDGPSLLLVRQEFYDFQY